MELAFCDKFNGTHFIEISNIRKSQKYIRITEIFILSKYKVFLR